MLRVLIDAHCFDYNSSEGINTYLKGLYLALIPIAKDITFVFTASNIERIQAIFGLHPNVEYARLSSNNKLFRLLFELPQIIKQYKIDAAHFQYTSPPLKNCKHIVTLHDILFVDYPDLFPKIYRVVKGMLFKSSAKKADLLCTVSEYSKERINKHYNIDLDRIIVTPNAVSHDFAEVSLPDILDFKKKEGIGHYILYVSRIEPRKNHLPVIKAYLNMRLWEKGYELVFVGRPTIPVPEIDELINSLDPTIKTHIRFYPYVTYECLKLWYAGADLFIYPALAEGFGIPPIEAGMSGIPTICNNKTAMADFKFFGDNLIDISNTDLLQSRIEKNLSGCDNKALKNIQESILSIYNWERSAKIFYTALKGLERTQSINSSKPHQ